MDYLHSTPANLRSQEEIGRKEMGGILGNTLLGLVELTRNVYSVRSREGRRNRAPPPRVRYNKDGKKVNPQQQAAKTTQA